MKDAEWLIRRERRQKDEDEGRLRTEAMGWKGGEGECDKREKETGR